MPQFPFISQGSLNVSWGNAACLFLVLNKAEVETVLQYCTPIKMLFLERNFTKGKGEVGDFCNNVLK